MRRAALLLLAVLAACSRPAPVTPALWEVSGPDGERGWLFGTIHALPAPVDWRSARVERALAASDRLILEVADGGDRARAEAVFSRLGQSGGLPPLAQRLPPALRDELADIPGMKEGRLDRFETWAAALALAQLADDGAEPANGIDTALREAAQGKPIDQFEGLEGQLGIFDRLPEEDQRVLLAATVEGAASVKQEAARLAAWWAKGDMDAIARASSEGFLADPELRRELLTQRNTAWLASLETRLRRGERPFVAVGAAHLAGAQGLPALLAAQGWQVRRIQ